MIHKQKNVLTKTKFFGGWQNANIFSSDAQKFWQPKNFGGNGKKIHNFYSPVIVRLYSLKLFWCHLSHTCFVAGAYNGRGRRDASVRIIKNAPTTSKADIWLLWTTWLARPGEHTLCVNQWFSIPVLAPAPAPLADMFFRLAGVFEAGLLFWRYYVSYNTQSGF